MTIRSFTLVACCFLASVTLSAQSENATYYAAKFYGNLTSTGERLEPQLFTAASQQYDWGTVLEVTNKKNGRKVQVKVNDCGPHSPKAIIDLSQAAAEKLDMIRAGRVPVNIRVIRASTAGPTCHRGGWAKRLRAAGRPIPPPPPVWDPVETAGALTPKAITTVRSDVTTLPAAGGVASPATTLGLVGFYPQNADKKPTSTGEVYLHRGLTAASKNYPYNTILQVTNVVTGKTVRVRINDCGPVPSDRVVNVSRSAAFELGILATGPTQMKVEIIKLGTDGPTCPRSDQQAPAPSTKHLPAAAPSTNPANDQPATSTKNATVHYAVKLGAFRNLEGADRLQEEVRLLGFAPVHSTSDGQYVRVYAGRFTDKYAADKLRKQLRQAGFEEAIVRKIR